ncbi:hypothetical protein Tco_0882896 [Tanacetum coccineum]
MPPSFLPLSPSLFLCDSDLPRLILEKTLAGSGLPDMLRERPDLRPLPCSPLTFGVLDSECCDISCIFEFLLGHPANVFRTVDVGGLRMGSTGSLMVSLVLGFPSISTYNLSGRSGTLVGQRSAAIVIANADYLSQIVDLQVACRRGM